MEDSSLDWDELDDGGEVEKESGFGWVLSKGLNLGKNLVITGVVVSSVPIVVPPLLVVSALGFACSVPFGFMYASYTCTEKLMSKLLPTSSVHVIEYGEGEVVESEEKGEERLNDGFSEDVIKYPEELGNENDGLTLVEESEEVVSTVSEFGEDEEGLQYDGVNRTEVGLVTVAEPGKDEEGLQYDDIIKSEEGLTTVDELGHEEKVLGKNNVNTREEELITGAEFGTVAEPWKDVEGLQYDDIIKSEEGLRTVDELGHEEEVLGKNNVNTREEELITGAEFGTVAELWKDVEGLKYDDIIKSEEGLTTVDELGHEEEVFGKNNVNTGEEELITGTEFGEDEEGSQMNDANMNEEALITVAEFGNEQERLQKGDVNVGDTDGSRAIAAILVVSELDAPNKEMQSGGIDNREISVEVIEVSQTNNVNEGGLSTGTEFGKDEYGSQKDDVNMSEDVFITITEFGKDQEGLKKDDVNRGDIDEIRVTDAVMVMDELDAPPKDMQSGKDEEGPQNIDVSTGDDGLTTGAEFGKGDEGLQQDDMKMEDTDGNRARDAVMVTGVVDVPNKEDMLSGASVEETGVEVNRSGIENSRETKATDDAISQVQTIPSAVEMNDDRNKKEVTHHEVEDKTDVKGGENNDVRGSKGTDKGKKRHTNAKGKKKTKKTQKRVEGDVSKAHEKDVVKPETVYGKADVSLESENKLNIDKNEMQLPAQDFAEGKITGVVGSSKDNDAALSTSIEDIYENNKNAEPRDQAANVSVLVPVLEVSDSKSVPLLIQHEELVELKDDSVHVEGNSQLRNKEMPSDEEIWKQIDSIRTIVGFKVTRQTSYFEELKALYVFTGIEPPSIFSDPFDTAEVHDKLRFLMSVIGVK